MGDNTQTWRLRALQRMWEDTDLTSSEIAEECGYKNANVVKVLRHRHGLKKRKHPKSLFIDWTKNDVF